LCTLLTLSNLLRTNCEWKDFSSNYDLDMFPFPLKENAIRDSVFL